MSGLICGAVSRSSSLAHGDWLFFGFVAVGVHLIAMPVAVLLWSMQGIERAGRVFLCSALLFWCVLSFLMAYFPFHAIRSLG